MMHIGSTVTGQIRDDRDAVDAVDATFRQEHFPEHRNSVPARSSRNWNRASEAFTAVLSDIWILPETWIPVLPFAWFIRKTVRSVSGQEQGS